MRTPRRSLRAQLAVSGFLAIALPIVVLLGVSATTEATVVVDGVAITEGASSERSPWITWTAVALVPVAAVLAWGLAGRAVRPIERIRAVAADIEAHDLSGRIDLTSGPSEIVALAGTFDAMLDRVEQATTDQQRLIDEASHELRTPLTVLRTNAEVLLAHPEPTLEAYRQGLERTRSASLRLQATVDELLVDARRRNRAISSHDTDLRVLAGAVADDLRAVAAGQGVAIEVDGPPGARSDLDEPMVTRALANLVLNAIEFAPPDTTVELAVASSAEHVAVLVTDHGPGVASEHQDAVFDRGWQADPARRGDGLGLAIAHHVAVAHGGSLTVRSPGPAGDGAVFELRLPRPAQPTPEVG